MQVPCSAHPNTNSSTRPRHDWHERLPTGRSLRCRHGFGRAAAGAPAALALTWCFSQPAHSANVWTGRANNLSAHSRGAPFPGTDGPRASDACAQRGLAMKRRFLLGFACGAALGAGAALLLGGPGRAAPPEPAHEFSVDRPDAADPTGRALAEFEVYRVTTADRGVVSGTVAPPAAAGPRPTIVTLRGRGRVTYYGLPKR